MWAAPSSLRGFCAAWTPESITGTSTTACVARKDTSWADTGWSMGFSSRVDDAPGAAVLEGEAAGFSFERDCSQMMATTAAIRATPPTTAPTIIVGEMAAPTWLTRSAESSPAEEPARPDADETTKLGRPSG